MNPSKEGAPTHMSAKDYVLYFSLAGLTTAVGTAVALSGGQSSPSVQTEPTNPTTLVQDLNSLTYVKSAKESLEKPGLYFDELSIKKGLEKMGYSDIEMEIFGAGARKAKAGKEGLAVRTLPTSIEEFKRIGTLNWGEPVSWIAEVRVKNEKDNTVEIFGLLPTPHRISEVNPFQRPDAPNLFMTQDGKLIQAEFAYVRLGKVLSNGKVENYVEGPDYGRNQQYSSKLTDDGRIKNVQQPRFDYKTNYIGPAWQYRNK